MTKSEAYKELLKWCNLTEEEFLRIYDSHGTPLYAEEKSKLSEEQLLRFPHLFVAYQLLLEERGEGNE